MPWKIWLDLRFPRHPELKVNFKVTALDRGYFNFIFANKDGLLNNSGTFVFLISNVIVVSLSHIGIAMHVILVEMS